MRLKSSTDATKLQARSRAAKLLGLFAVNGQNPAVNIQNPAVNGRDPAVSDCGL
jgi:hypothetical protein